MIPLLISLLSAQAADFSYDPPGKLEKNGAGRDDVTVYIPGMRFPLESGPAYLNSQIYGHGGYQGPGGGQCDAENYSYPWKDDFCEKRSWDVALCPNGKGHQGQDIRPATCEKDVHWVVATEGGTITSVGSYSVSLTTATGTRHRYLHMDPSSLVVHSGDHVARGDRLGRVSDAFGDSATTIHLHYDIVMNVAGYGSVYVPPYMSLVRAYQELLGTNATPCAALPAAGRDIDNQDGCFQLFGNPSYWRHVSTEGQGGDLYWTNAWSGASPSNYARWTVKVAESGRYALSVNVLGAYGQTRGARYVVRAGAASETRIIDQTAATDGWISLGEHDLAADAENSVTVHDNTGESATLSRHLMADSLRVTRVETAVASSGEGGVGGSTSVGGSSGAGGSGGTATTPATAPPTPPKASTGKTCGCAYPPARASSLPVGLLAALVMGRRRAARSGLR